MGADAFHVCYGIRWEIDASREDEVALLEKRQDPRQLAAKMYGLKSWWGVTTNQNCYFLLVGTVVGNFGWEGEHWVQLQDVETARVVEQTRRRLREAGMVQEPAWHYQFEPDY